MFFEDFSFSHVPANPGPGSPVGWEGLGDSGKAGNCFLKDKIQTLKSSLGTHLELEISSSLFLKAIKMVNRFPQMASAQQRRAQARALGLKLLSESPGISLLFQKNKHLHSCQRPSSDASPWRWPLAGPRTGGRRGGREPLPRHLSAAAGLQAHSGWRNTITRNLCY